MYKMLWPLLGLIKPVFVQERNFWQNLRTVIVILTLSQSLEANPPHHLRKDLIPKWGKATEYLRQSTNIVWIKQVGKPGHQIMKEHKTAAPWINLAKWPNHLWPQTNQTICLHQDGWHKKWPIPPQSISAMGSVLSYTDIFVSDAAQGGNMWSCAHMWPAMGKGCFGQHFKNWVRSCSYSRRIL